MLVTALLRSCVWFGGLVFLALFLCVFLTAGGNSPACTYTVSRLLLTLLFLQRAILELYAWRFRSSSTDAAPSRFFRGRSALWLRLALGLVVLMTAFLAVVDGMDEVFLIELVPSSSSGGGSSSSSSSSSKKTAHQHQSGGGVDLTDHSSNNKPYHHRHASVVDAPREHGSGGGNDAARNRQMRRDAFSPGAIDSYQLLLHEHPLCALSTSTVAVAAVWAVHCLCALICRYLTVGALLASSRTRNDTDVPKNNNCWALQLDTFDELKLATNIAVACVAVNWASRTWSLDPSEEVPAYIAFATGAIILLHEASACTPFLRALTFALSEGEVRVVAALEKAIAREASSVSVSSEEGDVGGGGGGGIDFSVNAIRAHKTHRGALGLFIECGVPPADSAAAEGKIRQIISQHPVFDRTFDQKLIRIR